MPFWACGENCAVKCRVAVVAVQTAQTYERAIFLTAVSAKDAVSETRPAERFLRTTEGEIVHRRIVL